MNVDAIIAVAVFIGIVTWSFTFYYGLFETGEDFQKFTIDNVGDNILDAISVETYTIPIPVTSSENLTNHVFFFLNYWEGGNGSSTKVYEDGSQINCQINNSEIYWMSDFSSGESKDFEVRYVSEGMPLNCTETTYMFQPNMSKVVPHSTERKTMISDYKISILNSTNYYKFRS